MCPGKTKSALPVMGNFHLRFSVLLYPINCIILQAAVTWSCLIQLKQSLPEKTKCPWIHYLSLPDYDLSYTYRSCFLLFLHTIKVSTSCRRNKCTIKNTIVLFNVALFRIKTYSGHSCIAVCINIQITVRGMVMLARYHHTHRKISVHIGIFIQQ